MGKEGRDTRRGGGKGGGKVGKNQYQMVGQKLAEGLNHAELEEGLTRQEKHHRDNSFQQEV